MTQVKERFLSPKMQFLLKNLLRGIAWLAVLVTCYILAKKYLDFDLKIILGSLYENWRIIFLIFFTSEVIFGIIPPEFFMFWALRHEDLSLYLQNVAVLAAISYAAGIIGYYIGSYFNTTRAYRALRKNVFGKFEKHFNTFGGFLVIVAALTPIPYSGICMIVGSVKYNFRNFIWISLMRFVRFAVYSIIIWEANILN
jgi:membrane protein YqaA with SNARE-associated domain